MSTRTAIGVAALALCLTLASTGSAELVAYDAFDYGPLPNLGGATGGMGWSGPWQDYSNNLATSVSGPGLSWPGLPGRPGGAVTPSAPSGTEWTDYFRTLGAYNAPDHKLYISYLFLPTPNYGSYGGLQVGTYPSQVQFGAIPGYYLYGLRIGHYGLFPSNIPEVPGQTAFLVLEIQAVPASNTTYYRLYVDPAAGSLQPQYPSVEGTTQGAFLPTVLELYNDGGVTTDEIRVGTTWADVTAPSTCRGDCNCDGRIDFSDINAFVAALNGVPPCDARNCDINGDGRVDFTDINPFVTLLTQGGGVCP